MTNRRSFLKGAGTVGALGLTGTAGCIGQFGEQPYGNGEINFLMSPTEPQDYMMSQYAPVRDHLQAETGVECKLKYAQSYSSILEALASGTGDVAETGPFAAALGVRTDPPKGEIVLQRFAFGSWTYSSVIVTRDDTDITELTDLEGKTIAFADTLSASGSLFPLFMLKQAGLDIGEAPGTDEGADFQASWSGHSSALEALKNEQADAAGVGRFITLTENEEGERVYKDWIRELAREKGIPRAPILVSPELSDQEQSDVVDAFLNAPDEMYLGADGEEDPDDDPKPDDLWFSDVREADKGDFQIVVDVANELGISAELLDPSE